MSCFGCHTTQGCCNSCHSLSHQIHYYIKGHNQLDGDILFILAVGRLNQTRTIWAQKCGSLTSFFSLCAGEQPSQEIMGHHLKTLYPFLLIHQWPLCATLSSDQGHSCLQKTKSFKTTILKPTSDVAEAHPLLLYSPCPDIIAAGDGLVGGMMVRDFQLYRAQEVRPYRSRVAPLVT